LQFCDRDGVNACKSCPPLYRFTDSHQSTYKNGSEHRVIGLSGQDFARRWEKLSDELKIHILRFSLVFEKPVEYMTNHFATERILHKHLAMGPEIASFSCEIYYQENAFRFNSIYAVGNYDFIDLPSAESRSLIRNVELVVCVEVTDWRFMQSMLADRRGFDHLQSLQIEICWDITALEPFLAVSESISGENLQICSRLSCKPQVFFEKPGGAEREFIKDAARQYGHTFASLQKKIEKLLIFDDNTDSEMI
jgi:hypothetical protein